jgi:HD-GYP domain-containing protein (c-di-GMP phosphodiesterase class II)
MAGKAASELLGKAASIGHTRPGARLLLLGLPQRAAVVWLLAVAAAIGLVAVSWPAALYDAAHATTALLFIVVAAAAERYTVRLRSSRPGAGVSISVTSALYVAVVLLFPLAWAILIGAFGFALAELLRRQRDVRKVAYNVANVTISVAAASALWHTGSPPEGLNSILAVPWIALAAVTYFVANTLLTATIVALVLEMPIGLVWWRGHRHILFADLGLHAVGVPIAGLWLAFPWMLSCVAIALVALYRAIDDRVKLESQTLESLFKLADILDDRDKYTHGHSERVGFYSEQLAIQLGLSSDRANLTFLAGRLHDIGKCAISNEVLHKPGALDDDERSHMRQHPSVGSAMLGHFTLFREVAQYVRGHHERWDGKGYPDGLRGEDIPLESRIISVVDSYDAMTTTRPYRAALPEGEAVRRLREGADQQWDPRVVEAFLTWLDRQSATSQRAQPLPADQATAA